MRRLPELHREDLVDTDAAPEHRDEFGTRGRADKNVGVAWVPPEGVPDRDQRRDRPCCPQRPPASEDQPATEICVTRSHIQKLAAFKYSR
ncbi:hypothetical protein RE9431_34760 [Prescottella equi]|nr:hypothetical protein RE9414_34850 [Prescottella equi]BCN65021.1 hypothetical protein RE9431_34760 [Prescottella equi]BCN74869.1 hypothetical protein RE0327_34680 [Prescottella equi]BCN84854.1 hypothetical protein RE0356_34950 [Prescottella equi]BDC73648.1 hypothetical protein KAREA_35630 [Prescottella equi]